MDLVLHSRYMRRCVKYLLCFRELDWLPNELAYLIIDLCWQLRSEPVFIIYIPDDPVILNDLLDLKRNWYYVIKKFKELHPGLRCYDHNSVKKLTNRLFLYYRSSGNSRLGISCLRRYPFGLLIPGSLWDKKHLSIQDNDPLSSEHISNCKHLHLDSIQILNGWVSSESYVVKDKKYTYYNFEKWLSVSFKNRRFSCMQDGVL